MEYLFGREDYSPNSGFNVASTMALDLNVGDVTITYVNYLKMVCLLESGLGGMNNNINGTWMGIYSSLTAAGFSMGVKNSSYNNLFFL